MRPLHVPSYLVLFFSISATCSAQEHAWVYHTSFEHHEYAPIQTAASESGEVLSFGYSSADSLFWLMRTDLGGDLIGAYELEFPGAGGLFKVAACIELAGGDIALLATPLDLTPVPNEVVVFRLTAGMQSVWGKRLTYAAGPYGRVLRGYLQAADNGALLLMVDQLDSFCLTEVASSGDVNWSRRYVNTSFGGYSADLSMFRANDEALYVARNEFWSPNKGVSVTKFNLNGLVEWSRSYYFGVSPNARALDLTSNGDLLIAGVTYADGPMRPFTMKIDQTGAYQWRMEYWDPQAWISECEQILCLSDQSMLVRSGYRILHIDPSGTLLSDKKTLTGMDFRLHTTIAAGTALTQRLVGVLHYTSLGWSPGARLLDVAIGHADLTACGMSTGALNGIVCSVDSVLWTALVAIDENVLAQTEEANTIPLSAERQELCDFANTMPAMDSSADEGILRFFPMPTSNEMSFVAPVQLAGGMLTLRDATGRLVLQQRIMPDRNSIDVSALAKGVYVYEAVARIARFTGRIVKE